MTYDNIAPKAGTPAANIKARIADKIAIGQAEGGVINLNDSNVTFDELQAAFSQNPIPGLKGVLIVRGRTVRPLKL